jgi:hypothetical protein
MAIKPPLITSAGVQPGKIKFFTISKKTGDGTIPIDITGAISEFFFYESVLSNSVTATAVIVDTGTVARDNYDYKTNGLINGYQLVGGERVDFAVEDNNPRNAGNNLSILNPPNGMYINRIRDIGNSGLKNTFAIDLVTPEFITNEKTRLTQRYDGKISNHVKDILNLLTAEELKYEGRLEPEIEETSINYNFIGNEKKPLYSCTWLATKSSPNSHRSIGTLPGYFFYQTRNRFHFVSVASRISGLNFNKPIKKYLYNGTGKLDDTQYDANILTYAVDQTIDLGKDLALGTYNNRSIFFDPVGMNYRFVDYDIVKDGNLSAEDYPTREITESPTRLMYHVLDIGTLPEGVNSDQQLQKWKTDINEPNYKADQLMAQAIMRYNEIFHKQIKITLPGDFVIEAGDIIDCDFQSLNSDEIDKKTSGRYMVASVCHKITPTETFTTADLITDVDEKQLTNQDVASEISRFAESGRV